MDKYINCQLLNIEYDIENQVYNLKTNNNLFFQSQYKIIFVPKLIESSKLIHIQFNIHTLFIKSIEYIEKNKIKKITNIHPDGFLVSIDFSNSIDKVELIFYPDNINDNTNANTNANANANANSKDKGKCKIYIKKKTINIYQINELNKIHWDNIFIINLKRRTDRKIAITKQFKLQKITKYEFIDGVDGTDLEILDKFLELKNNHKTQIVSSGHYACLLSHIKVIEEAKSRGYSNIMILEDDVVLCDNFINQLNKINIPLYDMIYLGGITNKKKVFFSHWVKSSNILGAYGYIISSNLFDYVLEELKKLTDYVDLFYMKNIQLNYRVILLDDMIKTNLDTSDTSGKSSTMTRRLSYIKIIKN